ncbi:ABC-type transport system involved in multi-copper enzyme maturation permease subunit [Desulfohalotomaculum tongense]|uniref:ABC transporter permease subunit n=1 Tax=Desulforadius tongensis TaxID=1216062 RepID=UPI00195E535D|nr:ABC-type transport system involved in multi-copper enzyme maturation permease subunit [Desulforadius tongensis]
MAELIKSEWERLWLKKSTWLCFSAIPFMVYAAISYYTKKNMVISQTSPEYTNFLNFPVAALQEQLISAVNVFLILFVVLSITEEYRSGQLRMVMIRRYNIREILSAKYIVILTAMFLFLLCYFIFSFIEGYIFLPKNNTTRFFFREDIFLAKDAVIYCLKYYLLAFATMIAVASMCIFVSLISRSTTVAVGANIAIVLFLAMGTEIVKIFAQILGCAPPAKIMFSSIIHIQYKGIYFLLSGSKLNLWIMFIILVYTAVFSMFSYLYLRRKDSFM